LERGTKKSNMKEGTYTWGWGRKPKSEGEGSRKAKGVSVKGGIKISGITPLHTTSKLLPWSKALGGKRRKPVLWAPAPGVHCGYGKKGSKKLYGGS